MNGGVCVCVVFRAEMSFRNCDDDDASNVPSKKREHCVDLDEFTLDDDVEDSDVNSDSVDAKDSGKSKGEELGNITGSQQICLFATMEGSYTWPINIE